MSVDALSNEHVQQHSENMDDVKQPVTLGNIKTEPDETRNQSRSMFPNLYNAVNNDSNVDEMDVKYSTADLDKSQTTHSNLVDSKYDISTHSIHNGSDITSAGSTPEYRYQTTSQNNIPLQVHNVSPETTFTSPLSSQLRAEVYLEMDDKNKPIGKSVITRNLNLRNLDTLKCGLAELVSEHYGLPPEEIVISLIVHYKPKSKVIIASVSDVIFLYTSHSVSGNPIQLGITWKQSYLHRKVPIHGYSKGSAVQNTIEAKTVKQVEVIQKTIMADVYLDVNKCLKKKNQLKGPCFSIQLDVTDLDTIKKGIKLLIEKEKGMQRSYIDISEIIFYHLKKKATPITTSVDVIKMYTLQSHADTAAKLGVVWNASPDAYHVIEPREFEYEKVQTDNVDSLSPVASQKPSETHTFSEPMKNTECEYENVQTDNVDSLSPVASRKPSETHTFSLTSENIIESIQSLWIKKSLCDVTLVCEGNVEIKAHRLILASQSATFLDNNIFEGCSGVYNLRETKPEIMTHILEYMYGKPVRIPHTDFKALHMLVEQLDIKPLITACDEVVNITLPGRTSSNPGGVGDDREMGEECSQTDDEDMDIDYPESALNEDISPSADEDGDIGEINKEHIEIEHEKKRVKSSSSTIVKTTGKGRNRRFVCDLCSRTFRCKDTFKKHMLRKHSADTGPIQYEEIRSDGIKKYKCVICGKVFHTLKQCVTSHINKHECHKTNQKKIVKVKSQEGGPTEETTKQYSCHVCHTIFKMQTTYENHKCVPVVNKDQPYSLRIKPAHEEWRVKLRFTESQKCPNCKDQFIVKGEMEKHLKDYHRYRMLYCENKSCNEIFMTQDPAMLEKHLADAHEKPWLQCMMCEFRTTLWVRLNKHMLGEHAKVMCLYCDKVTYNHNGANRMLYHLKSKHDIVVESRLFQCPYEDCTFTAYVADQVNVHLTKHTNERPITCDQCPMNFKTEG